MFLTLNVDNPFSALSKPVMLKTSNTESEFNQLLYGYNISVEENNEFYFLTQFFVKHKCLPVAKNSFQHKGYGQGHNAIDLNVTLVWQWAHLIWTLPEVEQCSEW